MHNLSRGEYLVSPYMCLGVMTLDLDRGQHSVYRISCPTAVA